MSGSKETYVNVTSTAYNKMMNATREVENIDSKIRSRLSSQSKQLNSQFNSQMDRANKRFNQQEKITQKLSSNMRSMEKSFSKQFRKQEKQMREQQLSHQRDIGKVNKRLDFQRKEYIGLIDQQGREFSQQLNRQREELNGKIESLAKEIERKEKDKRKQAEIWLSDTNVLIELVEKTYRHEKFKPNELNKLKQQMELNRNNINSGVYEAAIASTQQTWLKVNELRAELEMLENEWDTYHLFAQQSNNELIATCDSQELVKLAFDLEDGVEELDVKIDYWTEGKLSALKDKATEQKKMLDSAEEMTVDDFKKQIQESEELKKEVLALTEEAKEALILSQLRQNSAEDIAEILEEAHFEVTDSCYKGDDQSKSLHLKMENPGGDEIVTVITPMENRANKINVHFYDKAENEGLRKERLKGILKALSDKGLEVGDPVCIDDRVSPSEKNSEKDFDTIRDTKVQQRKSF